MNNTSNSEDSTSKPTTNASSKAGFSKQKFLSPLMFAVVFGALVIFNFSRTPPRSLEAKRYEQWLKGTEDLLLTRATQDELLGEKNKIPGQRHDQVKSPVPGKVDPLLESIEVGQSITLTIDDGESKTSKRLESMLAPDQTLRLFQLIREVDFFSMSNVTKPTSSDPLVSVAIHGGTQEFSHGVSLSSLREKPAGALFLTLFSLFSEANRVAVSEVKS